MSQVTGWIRPSFWANQVFGSAKTESEDEIEGILQTRGGVKDVVEVGANVCEWMAHLDINKEMAETAGGDFETVSKGLAIPEFFHSFNELRRAVEHQNNSDADHSFTIFNKAVVTVKSGSESVLFLDRINFFPLAYRTVNIVKGMFWSAIGLLDGINFFHQISKIDILNKDISSKKEGDVERNILQHRVQQKYLVILQSAASIAMAAIALVGIVFEIVLAAEIMLTLTSVWLVLNFTNHFYKAEIGRWKQQSPLIGV